MNYMQYSSKLLEAAVDEFARLPGIGHKTALRLALYLLKQDKEVAQGFGKTIIRMCEEIRRCKICQNISDTEVCMICSDSSRDSSTICVVENIRDVMSIENTHQYRGLYHILGGIISPMDGVGPKDLYLKELDKRLEQGGVREIILALSTTMEGDTTSYYLFKRYSNPDLIISTIARGVSVGDELEYADEVTLGRSILYRTPFKSQAT